MEKTSKLNSEETNELCILMDDILLSNEYVNELEKKASTNSVKKDKNSLSYLVDCKYIMQSDCIKLGISVEKLFANIILKKNNDLKNIKEKNTRGKKEKDHLFCNKLTKTIYYAELKSNIYLDTEKTISTKNKIINIKKELENEYDGYIIKTCFVCERYLDKNEIPINIFNKYSDMENNGIIICGVNNYFEELNIQVKFDLDNYIKFLNNIILKTTQK